MRRFLGKVVRFDRIPQGGAFFCPRGVQDFPQGGATPVEGGATPHRVRLGLMKNRVHIVWQSGNMCSITSFSSDSITFFVDRWRAENENNVYFHSLLNSDNTLSWERVFEMEDTSLDRIKLAFLSAPLFEGKTFWDVENKLAWLEEGKPLHKRP